MLWIAIIIAFVALVIATITDIQKREVPDYVSYALMFIAAGITILYSIINWDYQYLMQSVMGFVIGLAVAFAMFYLGQWGGGDSKLIMGLGAIIGFNIFPIFGENNFWLLILVANIVFAGAIYGLIWSIALALKNRKLFIKNLTLWSRKNHILMIRKLIIISVILLIIIILLFVPENYKLLVLLFIAMFYIIFYMWLFVKVIEETCMVKNVPVSKLTEGDWIFKNVYIGKKYITGPKDLGVSRSQIELLKKYARKGKIKTVTIKEGIPFIPVFLIAYILTIMLWYMHVF